MGYMSIYEKDLFLEFKKGVLLNKREVDNTKTFDHDLIPRCLHRSLSPELALGFIPFDLYNLGL
jgi:hypothetical protein